MQLCYVDESGDTQSLRTAVQNVTPVCVIVGVSIEQAHLAPLTHAFLALKRAKYPTLCGPGASPLDWVLSEIKGSDIRRSLRSGAQRRNRRHAVGFLDKFIDLLEQFDVKILGRVWVKDVGKAIDARAIYTSSVQSICSYFQNHLTDIDDTGLVIADSRHFKGNVQVAHSIFTQKFKSTGDAYDRILEMPTFGHSDNHAMIQVADLVASAMLFPMATFAFCRPRITNVHVDPDFGFVTGRYGPRLKRLQYRFIDSGGRWRGGITVDDKLGHKPGHHLFRV